HKVRCRARRPGGDPRVSRAGQRVDARRPHPALPPRGRADTGERPAPMNVGLNQLLVASAALFAFGAFGTFGLGTRTLGAGAAVALFAGATAVAELAVGLTMAALIYREHRS